MASKIPYLRALIVDDSNISRSRMFELCKKAGFKHLDQVENAADAAEKMDALKYDIVFLDWTMPGKSGISLREEWREDRRYDDVAIIVCSMQSDPRMVNGALKAGAISYIVKPVTEETLNEHLSKALAWLDRRQQFKEDNT